VPAYPGFSGGPIVDKSTHAVVGVFSGHLRPEDQTQIDYQGVGPALILKFLADAEALTHAPFTQISMEAKSEAAASAPSDPISQVVSSEYARPVAAAGAAPAAPLVSLSGAAAASSGGNASVAAPSAPKPPLTEASDFPSKLAAAQAGDPAGEFLTALAYQNGIGVEPDLATGIRWLQQAAIAKYPPALTALALAYQNGAGVDRDDAQALSLYQSAAGLGDIQAALVLGRTYHYGKLGTTPDEAQSKAWYGKGLAAATAASGRGDGTATWMLANAYLKGIGVDADPSKGLALLALASGQGSAGATNNLALAYMRGRLVPRDTTKGIALLTKSAELGGPKSALDLSDIYFRGSYGVPADPQKALRYLEQAAALGNAQAMWKLGVEALAGKDEPMDLSAAGSWFRKATALMYLPGETQYGRWLVATGPPAARDPARGLAYIQDAADKGWSGAQWYLGTFYHEGQFVPRDEAKAFTYFQKAALAGNRSAQFDLGHAYEQGLGVTSNPDLAHFWYQLAANQGDVAAQRKLEVATK
jgi:TPR repeat protein